VAAYDSRVAARR